MPSVDNRIVRMEFDNATFEAKIKQTIASLGHLDKALKMEGAHKGLADVSKAAGQVNLGPLQTSIQSVSASFLALSTIAITALANITTHVLRAAASMASAFTFAPIQQGFQEFELQMGSIQTILANTRREGTQLSDVTAALDQLNTYADQTIYNFGQMTKNIGTFTAAGVNLETSVQSIKGISNLAAISGSSAEQAASAMYQLSQAISTGTLRLIDWNSVVNAGMGGEVFQRALFDTGVAMGTITDAPVGTTFDDWTAAGNSFRDSLESGWLTADVLTSTLSQFTGDMTEAQLLAIGFTKEQAAEILALGAAGVEAATKVRTLTQLMSTLKEGLASGWAQSFRIILGDFNEATQLFTGLSQSIGGFFSRQTEARNAVLQGWADLGGRTELLQGLENAFFAIGRVLSEVGKAFRDIFPATTADRLFQITQSFTAFTESLKPSEQTIENVRRIFTGLFAALDIGWTVIREGAKFIKDLVVQLLGLGQGNFLQGAAGILDFFTNLRDALDGGAKIEEFFDNLTRAVQKPIAFIHELKDTIFAFFEGLAGGTTEAAEAGVERIGERFGGLATILERLGAIGDMVADVLSGVMDILGNVGEAIIDWFQELGDKLADAIGPGEFNNVLDALNVSLLGGIGLLIANFLRGGLNLDVGGGFFNSITEAFGQLTGTLEAMQTSIRADALLKIAGAVGILAASMVALSLIDSAALTRALVAMAVGFGQLMATFAVLNATSTGLTDGASFTIIATGMVILSTAVLILAGAVALLAQLGWEEVARGLAAVATLLAIMTAAAIVLSANSGNLIAASIGLTAMAIALNLLIVPVMALAQMNWSDLARGLGSLAILLGVIAVAGIVMAKNAGGLALVAVGMIGMAVAIGILTGAVLALSQLSIEELAKGLGAITILLVILGGAAAVISHNAGSFIGASISMIAMAVAIDILAGAMLVFGNMDWSEIAKGLVTIAAALLILVVAAHAVQGAVGGAAAILIMSAAMAIMGKTLIEISEVPFGDLIKAIGAIAIALTVFGIAAALLQPVIPALLGLGVALLLVGGAFALFGVGALAVAKAFEILAEAGPDAADAIIAGLEALGAALPAVVRGFAEGIVELIKVFVEAAPVIAEALGVLLVHILDTLIEITPKVGELMLALIDIMILVLQESGPRLIEAGIALLIALLQGIRANIGTITTLVADIIIEFLNALAAKAGEITTAGTNLLVALLLGITNNLYKVTEAVGTLITTLISGISNQITRIVEAGANAVIAFIQGIGRNAGRIVTAGVDVVIQFLQGIASNGVRLANAAFQVVIDFLNSLATVIRQQSPALRAAGVNIATAIADGITGGLASKASSIANSAVSTARGAVDKVTNFLGIGSPSKVFIEIGEFMGEGMQIGIDNSARGVERSAEDMANTAVSSMRTIVSHIADEMGGLEDLHPTITPVLDLTEVRSEAARLSKYISDAQPLVPAFAVDTAQMVAGSPTPRQSSLDAAAEQGRGDLIFNQEINAPTELSPAVIYKQTRNQITLAKEELDVP